VDTVYARLLKKTRKQKKAKIALTVADKIRKGNLYYFSEVKQSLNYE
jgi:hypothetical protein